MPLPHFLGTQLPIIQAPMAGAQGSAMAVAVSNAGGLGIITALTQRTPEDLAKEIAKCRGLTDKPFGVNLTFLPSVNQPDYPGYIKAIIEGGVKIVETAGNNPVKWLPVLKENGIKVVHKCTAVRHALEHLPAHQGLVKLYAPAFTANRHEALDTQQLLMARYRADGVLVPA